MKKLLSTTALVAAMALTPAIGEEPLNKEGATFGTDLATGETIYTDDNDNVGSETAIDNYENSKMWDIMVLGNMTADDDATTTIVSYDKQTSSDMMETDVKTTTIIVKNDETIVEAAMETERLSTLATLIQIAGMENAFKGDEAYTVFAPSNAAFAKLDDDTVNAFLRGENTDELRDILKGHVVEGKVMATDVTNVEAELETLGETIITVERDEMDDVRASDILVTKADIKASNGIIHIVDEVIIAEREPYYGARGLQ